VKRQAGITLLEVLIAVTLLSLLSAGMMMAMRIGISALSRTDRRLMDNRRVAGAQRVLEQELQGILPVVAPCGNGGAPVVIFSGQTSGLTMVTAFSLEGAWRGRPQIIQIFSVPGDDGGMRLVVNETPYTGPENAGKLCTGVDGGPRFPPPTTGPSTYVLADHLREVRFQYLGLGEKIEDPGRWFPLWPYAGWPLGVRIQIIPADPNPARLQPISVTVPIYVYRDPTVHYADQ
jgi:type II secretory pathway pseudopilin PulG